MALQLVDTDGRPLRIGQRVKTFDGTGAVLTAIQVPHKPESTGRVYVQLDDCREPTAFFPSVIGAKWIGRTDGGAP